jgi:DNA-binding MarR family transcriptional regulator
MVRFDELPRRPYNRPLMAISSREVLAVQRYYPQIYLACHTRHHRRRSNPAQLTSHDSALLAHLREESPVSPSSLARHLGVGRPTVSAAIKRLLGLGYLSQTRDTSDARALGLWLTPKGTRALQMSSVLDTKRVTLLLAGLSTRQRAHAIEGLQLLAQAATELPHRKRGTE